jgi:uncharacterized protein YbdZ (MbtH family)
MKHSARLRASFRASACPILMSLGIAFLVLGCGSSPIKAGSNDVKPPDGWTVHHDPIGFAVAVPPGWKVKSDPKSGKVDLAGPQDQQVAIWAGFFPHGLDQRSAAGKLMQLSGAVGTEVRVPNGWSPPQAFAPTAVRTFGKAGGRAAVCVLTWVPSPVGAAAFLYATAAPESRYRRDQDDFARILASVRLTGAPSAGNVGGKTAGENSAPEVRYLQWTDPREDAFTIDVPAGWDVQGGMIHRNALDPRAVLRVTSPDGAILLSGGDAELPGFVLPNPQWVSVFPEGSWYSPGAGIQWQVRRFIPAVPFGEQYLGMRLPSICSHLAIKDRRDRPDFYQLALADSPGLRQIANVQDSFGELAFTCSQKGQPKQGYLFVWTQLMQMGGLNLWYAKSLYGYLASPERVAEAEMVLAHMVNSVKVNPQWVAQQSNTAVRVSEIEAKTNQQISDMIMKSYWNKEAAHDESMRRWENRQLETTDVIDPLTGEQRKVDNRSSYYWVDQHGVIVGTQTSTSPGIDFRQMTQLP